MSWIDAGGCNTPPVTDFGTVNLGSSNVTSADCVVKFGASNDTSALRVYQQDGRGKAMFRPPSGVADPTFDGNAGMPTPFQGNGFVSTAFSAGLDQFEAIAVQTDGKIVAVGVSNGGAGGSDFAVARYNTDGSLDTTCGGNGKPTFNITSQDWASAVAIQADGKIIVTGASDVSGANPVACSYPVECG